MKKLTLIVLNSVLSLSSFLHSENYRIAFVKQVTYQDLYCASHTSTPSEIIFSSLKRTGPVGLFTRLQTDFYIVNEELDPECQSWKEKALVCHQKPISFYYSLKTVPQIGHTKAQGDYAFNCSDIDWGLYDIVIAMDAAIPARITMLYPRTLWVYYIGETGQPSYRNSLNKLVAGYDYFLSQNFEPSPCIKSHVIECPYMIQYYPCYEDLLKINIEDSKRSGIALECHTSQYFSESYKKQLSMVCPIVIQEKGTNVVLPIKSMIEQLMFAKYFIIYIPSNAGVRNLLQGNALIEAVCAGCLVLARKGCLKNKEIINKETEINSLQDILKKIKYFEENPGRFKQELELQRRNVNYLCFERPVKNLFEKCNEKRMGS